jgi:hypothetical protein
VKGQSVDLTVKMALKAGASALIVLGADGKTTSTIDDLRTLQDGQNFKLIYLDAGGPAALSGPPVTLSNLGDRVLVSAKSPVQTVSIGTWSVAAKGLSKSKPIEVVADTVYDLLLIRSNSGRYSELVLPHLVIEKPKLAGMSKAD